MIARALAAIPLSALAENAERATRGKSVGNENFTGKILGVRFFL